MAAKPKQHRPHNRKAAQKRYDATRPDRSFYWSTAWRKVREQQLRREPLCELCLERGITQAADQADHKLPRRDYPELALELSNLRSLCARCHARHGDKAAGVRRPIPPEAAKGPAATLSDVDFEARF